MSQPTSITSCFSLLRSLIGLVGLLILPTSVAFGFDTTLVEIHYPNGLLKERYHTTLDSTGQPIKVGVAEEWYTDGTLKGIIHWTGGLEEGDVIYYHPDGRKSYATHYQMGKKFGFATVWYPNGQKQWEAMYQSGQTNGVWREWYSDGKRKFEALYDRGKLNGHATWWFANGHIQQERDYNQGVSVSGTVKAYDSLGVLIFPAQSKTISEKLENEPLAKTRAP